MDLRLETLSQHFGLLGLLHRGGEFHFESTLMLLDGGADWRLTNKQGKGLIDYLLVIAKRMPPDGPSDRSSAWWKN